MLTKALSRISVIAFAIPLGLAAAVDTAAAECKPGYVWRDAKDGDGVCVTPDDRAERGQQPSDGQHELIVHLHVEKRAKIVID